MASKVSRTGIVLPCVFFVVGWLLSPEAGAQTITLNNPTSQAGSFSWNGTWSVPNGFNLHSVQSFMRRTAISQGGQTQWYNTQVNMSYLPPSYKSGSWFSSKSSNSYPIMYVGDQLEVYGLLTYYPVNSFGQRSGPNQVRESVHRFAVR